MIIIDATNKIAGRIATFAAKNAILGKEVAIINSEKAIISGRKRQLIEETIHKKTTKGTPKKGPFYYKSPDKYLKRIIRGMIPYKKYHGKRALKRIKCYIGIPKKYSNIEKNNNIPDVSKFKTKKYITLENLCKEIGGKINENNT